MNPAYELHVNARPRSGRFIMHLNDTAVLPCADRAESIFINKIFINLLVSGEADGEWRMAGGAARAREAAWASFIQCRR